jgi:hypothetical protein
LQDTATLVASVDQAVIPHKAYLRVACLEMERFRRRKERESAARRIESINVRFREIDAEEAALLQRLKERRDGKAAAAAAAPSAAPQSPQSRTTRVLRLRY